MKVNAKKCFSCLSALFAVGLATGANAQESKPIPRSVSSVALPKGEAGPLALKGIKNPLDILPAGYNLPRFHAHRVSDLNGGFRHLVGSPLYDNASSVGTFPNTFFYLVNNGDSSIVKQYLMDDFNLSPGLAHGAVKPVLNEILFSVTNTGTTDHAANVIILVYRDIVFGNFPDSAFANQVGGPNPLVMAIGVTTDVIPAGQGGLFDLPFAAAGLTPVTLDKDLKYRQDGVTNYNRRYAFVIGYCSDSTLSAFSGTDTALFNASGISVGHGEYWFDINGVEDSTTMNFPDGGNPLPGGVPDDGFNTSGFVYYFPDANNNPLPSNMWMEMAGTLGSNPNTFEFKGTISMQGYNINGETPTFDIYLQSLTGQPTIHLQSKILLADDPNASGNAVQVSYSATGIPADMYHVTVKSNNYLATLTHDAPYFDSMGNIDSAGYLSAAPYVLDLTQSNGILPVQSLLLFGGDATNDNMVNISDFGILVNTYGDAFDTTDSTVDPNDIAADFNGDGIIDIGDFGVLVSNYGTSGDPIN